MKGGKFKKIFVLGASLFLVILAVLSFGAPKNAYAQTTDSPGFLSQLFDNIVNTAIYGSTGNLVMTPVQEAAGTAPSNLAGNALTGTVTFVLNLVNQLLTGIASVILAIGASLISFTFQLNNYIMTMPVVLTGWKVTRDIANLGFTLALIVIAFMTILRVNQYSAQKMLPKLIAAAILVNFSLTIGGAILDFTNVVTNFFYDRSVTQGSASDIGTEITSAFNPQNLLNIDQTKIQQLNIESGLVVSLMGVVSTFFIAAFTFIMALTLLANGLMLLTRFVWLAFLMAIAPLPWLFSVIPIGQLQSEGKKWWAQFMKWAFVAPILSFFLYLTLATVNGLTTISQSILSTTSSAQNNPTLISQMFLQTTNMLIIVGFLIGGLIAANSMGIAGANALMGVAKKTGEKAKGWAGKQTVGGAGRLGRRALTAGASGDKDGKSWLERGGESLGRIPVVGGAFRGLAGASFGAKEESKKEIEKSQGENKKYSKELLAAKLDRQTIMAEDDVGAALALAEKGGWNLLNDGTKAKLVKAIKRAGATEKMAAFDPVAAAAAGMDLGKAVGKVEDVSKLDGGIIKQIAPHLRQQQIRDLGNKGTKEQKEEYMKGIQGAFISGAATDEKRAAVKEMFDLLDKTNDQLDATLKDYKDAKDLGKTEEMTRLQQKRNELQKKVDGIQNTLQRGGTYEVRETSNLLDSSGRAQETVVKTITIDTATDNEKDLRKKAIGNNLSAAKQTSWQGEGLYKERIQEHETL